MAEEDQVLVVRRKWGTRIAVLLLIAGIMALVYPQISARAFSSRNAKLKEEFMARRTTPPVMNTVDFPDGSRMNDTTYDALFALLESENKRLFESGQKGLTDAFSYEQPEVDLSAYGVQDNIIGFIYLPTISMEMPIYLGASQSNLRKGAVHMTQTSYPIGGPNTNTVIAAHRDRTAIMFRDIDKVEIGDEVLITNFRETLCYRAVGFKIIQPYEIEEILIQDGKDMLTLFSCHPLGSNVQRYVLYCERA